MLRAPRDPRAAILRSELDLTGYRVSRVPITTGIRHFGPASQLFTQTAVYRLAILCHKYQGTSIVSGTTTGPSESHFPCGVGAQMNAIVSIGTVRGSCTRERVLAFGGYRLCHTLASAEESRSSARQRLARFEYFPAGSSFPSTGTRSLPWGSSSSLGCTRHRRGRTAPAWRRVSRPRATGRLVVDGDPCVECCDRACCWADLRLPVRADGVSRS